MIDVQNVGTITDNGTGTGIRIDGDLSAGLIETFDTTGALCGSYDFGGAPLGCAVVMLRNAVAAGASVSVEPLEGSEITFDNVTTPGTATITPLTEPGGEVPANFQLFDMPIYYDVETTATVSGTITVCLPYPDSDNDGLVDGTTPPIDETLLKILHDEGGAFVDRTVPPIDTVNNQICAQVSALSQFVLGAVVEVTTTTMSSTTTTTLPPPSQQMKTGKLLVVKNPKASDPSKRKIVYKVKEQASTNTVAGDPTVSGAKLKVKLDGNTDCYDMPASGWSAISTLGFKYKDASGAYGPVKVASIKKTPSGNFMIQAKIMGKNGPITVIPPDPGIQADTHFNLGGGDEYCSTFGGGIGPNNDKTLKAKDAPAPTECNVTACSPSGAFLDMAAGVLD